MNSCHIRNTEGANAVWEVKKAGCKKVFIVPLVRERSAEKNEWMEKLLASLILLGTSSIPNYKTFCYFNIHRFYYVSRYNIYLGT